MKNKDMVKEISTVSEIVNVLNKLSFSNEYIFRGVNNKKQLLPKIIREGDYSEKEFEILVKFENFFGSYSNVSVNNCWEFVALAQHYGLMTRLIDFSTNPYIALFFALHSIHVDGEKYCLYVMKKNKLKDLLTCGLTRYPAETPFDNFLEGSHVLTIIEPDQKTPLSSDFNDFIKQMSNIDGYFYLSPNYKNSRILLQQGLFFVPKILDKQDIVSLYENEMDTYIISDLIREEILNYLDNLGYNEFKLMPDLNSVCDEINRRIKE